MLAAACLVGSVAAVAGPAACIIVALAFLAFVRRTTGLDGRALGLRLGAHLASVAGGAGLLIFLNVTAPGSLPLNSRLLGNAIIVVGFLPFLIWSDRREFPIPLFPAIVGIYVIYYGVPVFLTPTFRALRRPVAQSAIVPTQWVALGGLVMMEIGYYWAVFRERTPPARTWQPVANRTPESLLLWLGALGVLVYVYTSLVRVPVIFAQPVTLLTSLATLVAVEFFVRWRGKRLTLPGAVFLFGLLIPLRVIFGFSTGAINEALSALIAIGIAAATLRRRIVWIAVAAAVAALVVLQPIKVAYRKTNDYGATSLTQRLTGFAETGRDYALGIGEFGDAKDAFVVRYGFLTTLAVVMNDTPKNVPYWDGATYTPLLSKVFPRFLLPWKPKELTGQSFGHRYQLLGTYDTRTSYNMPITVELFANFGRTGLLLGMFLLGVVYAWAQRLALRRIEPVFGTGFAVFVVAQLAYIESALSFVLSGFLYSVVLVYLVGFGERVLGSQGSPSEDERLPSSIPS